MAYNTENSMLNLETIITPTLLLDEQKARQHIALMAKKAGTQSIRLRPHFKTHQSATIGEWFRQEGITRITCSSIQMAEYFASAGWKDIQVAFPFNLREITRANNLLQKIHLELLVESLSTVEYLQDYMSLQTDVWVKIDTGAGRTGISSDDYKRISIVCQAILESRNLLLRGLLTHAGHTYRARTREHAVATYQASITQLNQVRNKLKKDGIHDLEISAGDTPGCTMADDLGIVDEIRPGNFIFFDATQAAIGSCNVKDIAVTVACPVVAVHPDKEKVVVYGGAVHLSSEYYLEGDHKVYGLVTMLNPQGWGTPISGAYVSSLSQEHGILHVPKPTINAINPGDLLAILPAHSCITVSCLKKYLTLTGETITTMNCSGV